MKLRLILLLIFGLLVSGTINAQKIKIKNKILYVDGTECLKISGDANNVTFSDLEGNELFFLKYIRDTRYAPLYTRVTFFEQDISLTSSSYIFNKKNLTKKLLADGTLKSCILDSEKVKRFVLKYDEQVENR